MLSYQETKYEVQIIDETLIHFLLLKQKDEPLHEYAKRFKFAKEKVESHLGGPIKLDKFIKALDDFKQDVKKIQKLHEQG